MHWGQWDQPFPAVLPCTAPPAVTQNKASFSCSITALYHSCRRVTKPPILSSPPSSSSGFLSLLFLRPSCPSPPYFSSLLSPSPPALSLSFFLSSVLKCYNRKHRLAGSPSPPSSQASFMLPCCPSSRSLPGLCCP